MAASSSPLLAPLPAALLRHGASPRHPTGGPPAAASPSSSCRCYGYSPAPRGGLLLQPPARLPHRRQADPASARTVRLCGNGVYGLPAVLRGWSKGGSEKGLCAAGTGDDAGVQVGEDGYQDDDGVCVSNEALRATIRKSREVLAMHRNLLQQLSDKKKLISISEASSIHNEQEPYSGSSVSHSDAVSEGEEIGYDLEMYLDRRSQKSEVRSTHGESISGQHGSYGSLEGKLSNTDANGSSVKDYVAQRSQISEEEHSVTEGINDNSSSSAGVDVMNIILVAAECAPWSKTGCRCHQVIVAAARLCCCSGRLSPSSSLVSIVGSQTTIFVLVSVPLIWTPTVYGLHTVKVNLDEDLHGIGSCTAIV